MADGALREDVIAALESAPGVSLNEPAPNVIEVSKAGEAAIRTFHLKSTVCRGLLYEFERYYGVPISKFYPLPFSRQAQKEAV